jgi:Pyruvate/2-oxoacid:ferredoxin oxidoreductase delta subunit
MSTMERIGALMAALGILALLVAFLGSTPLSPWMVMGFTGTFAVSAGILGTINLQRYKYLVAVLLGATVLGLVLLALRVNLTGWMMFLLVFVLTAIGASIYFWGRFGKGPAGIKNNGLFHNEATRQGGVLSWMLAIAFTGFYIMLYWFPDQLLGLVAAADPLYHALTGKSSISADGQHVTNQWFAYGLVYTVSVLVMGFRFILKYRHSKYQILRTLSVAFFQLIIAFSLPTVFEMLNEQQRQAFEPAVAQYQPVYQSYESAKNNYYAAKDSIDKGVDAASYTNLLPGLESQYSHAKEEALKAQGPMLAKRPQVTAHYFSYFWPLGYDRLMPSSIEYYAGVEPYDGVHIPSADGKYLVSNAGFGTFGWVAIGFGIFMSFVGVVVLTYFFGKRWYCSWVCGCGGLAETAGDPFRQQSDKSLRSWQIERWTIYSVLALITLVTVLLLVDWRMHFLGETLKNNLKSGYGFLIGSMFAGVVGTGFYPILGSRVWCRFGCPQAAILGILQKYFSRFRITTNGGQCISCGNCSTYCEMGIDVKSYAQRGENIVRASCVGCGVCSSVCPRGVLNLENGPKDTRYNGLNPISISMDEIRVQNQN